MEDNKNEILDKANMPTVQDPEIFELGYLVNVILDYYTSAHDVEDGEEWKKGTEHERETVPAKIDQLVQKAFETQLKKFIK